jgi:LmbE family N-acetylglucosaminyl deacetylase
MGTAVSDFELALTSGAPCVFVSPHLDDAVLSCGALLSALAGHAKVTVVNVFTEASPPPYTRAARSALRRSGVSSAEELFAERRNEDTHVLASLGVQTVNLGFTDALFRRRGSKVPFARAAELLPELICRYPTYRLDIIRGRVSRGDRSMIATLADRLLGAIPLEPPSLVFVPVGVARHVDHLIVRDVATRSFDGLIYYSEFPYVLINGLDTEFLRRGSLTPWTWDQMLTAKGDLIAGYRTQFTGLFPDGVVQLVPELYHLPARCFASCHGFVGGDSGRRADRRGPSPF